MYLVQLQIIKQLIFYILFCCVRDNLSTLNALKLNLEFNQIILLRYQLSGAVFILTCTIFSSTTLNAEYQLNLNMCFNRIVLTCGGKKYKKLVAIYCIFIFVQSSAPDSCIYFIIIRVLTNNNSNQCLFVLRVILFPYSVVCPSLINDF